MGCGIVGLERRTGEIVGGDEGSALQADPLATADADVDLSVVVATGEGVPAAEHSALELAQRSEFGIHVRKGVGVDPAGRDRYRRCG